MSSSLHTSTCSCPLGQVPVPPPLPGEGQTIKKPYITNVPLPMLNWMPIRNAEHTIFQVQFYVELHVLCTCMYYMRTTNAQILGHSN